MCLMIFSATPFLTPCMDKPSEQNIISNTSYHIESKQWQRCPLNFYDQWPFISMSITRSPFFSPTGIKKEIGFSTSRHHTWYSISCFRGAVSMVQEQSGTESGYKFKTWRTKRMTNEWARLDELPDIALKLLGSARGGSCGAQNGKSYEPLLWLLDEIYSSKKGLDFFR